MATKKRRRTPAKKQKPTNTPDTIDGTAFDELTLDDAKAMIFSSLPVEYEVSRSFMAGDHWQDSTGWVGPIPDETDTDYATTVELIEKAFTSRNVIKELVLRHMRGVIGAEPTFGVVPRMQLKPGEKLNDEQAAAKRDIESVLTKWWNDRTAHLTIQKAVQYALWAERGVLRLYVPRGKLTRYNGTIPKQPTLEAALSLVYLDAPDPDTAAVYVDEDTKDRVGLLTGSRENGDTIDEIVEVTYLGPERSLISEDPNAPRLTVIRILTDRGEDETYSINIGGRILSFEICRSLLITTQQQQMQRAVNLCLSMIPRTVVTAGFLERVILNAIPPGHWLTDGKGRKTKFVREAWQTGPGTTQWVTGIELPGKDGTTTLTDPTVSWRDPVDAGPSSSAERSVYRDMLEEADQSHVLMTSEAEPSGKSRREGRSDFGVSLTETQAPTNGAGLWLIETLLALGEAFMQQPNAYLGEWRGQFECRVNAGPVSVEERAQAIAEWQAGLLSFETTQANLGVLDTQGEQDRIVSETGGVNLAVLQRQADVAYTWSQAGASIAGSAQLVGLTAADAKKLTPTDTGNTDPSGNPLPADGPPSDGPPADGGAGAGGQ